MQTEFNSSKRQEWKAVHECQNKLERLCGEAITLTLKVTDEDLKRDICPQKCIL